jgi:hypothetical protein
MRFSLDIRRARKGDCLLLHFGTAAKPGLIMIDGGPKNVYQPHLKPRLLELKTARGLGPQEPLPVDLLMVSHVDDDHIQGILDLTRELRAAGPNQAPLVRVAGLWHNSFDDIIGNTPKELTASVSAQFGAASLSGDLPPDASIDLGARASEENKEIAEATLRVLASIEQGSRLRGDAEALGWQRNPFFGGKLILADKKPRPIRDGLSFTAAGPMVSELKALQKKHDAWLEEQKKKKKKTPESSLAAYVDKSVPNLASVVMLAECGGKKMLLTGDARGDKVLEGLEFAGLLKKRGKIHVDLLKVPHHGSSNNVEPGFFQRITADHYVFSGNGEHGNPERETMQMLFKARGKSPFTVHLTYPVAEIDAERKADWQKEQAKEKKRGGKKRPNWNSAKHGLGAFFKTQKLAKDQKIMVVDERAPHVIDLLDPLGH